MMGATTAPPAAPAPAAAPVPAPAPAPAPAPPAAASRCPRCGGAFHCGAQEPAPCVCTQWALPAARLSELRARYTGCLCGECLRTLATDPAAAA